METGEDENENRSKSERERAQGSLFPVPSRILQGRDGKCHLSFDDWTRHLHQKSKSTPGKRVSRDPAQSSRSPAYQLSQFPFGPVLRNRMAQLEAGPKSLSVQLRVSP